MLAAHQRSKNIEDALGSGKWLIKRNYNLHMKQSLSPAVLGVGQDQWVWISAGLGMSSAASCPRDAAVIVVEHMGAYLCSDVLPPQQQPSQKHTLATTLFCWPTFVPRHKHPVR